jgi:hypothetical protein
MMTVELFAKMTPNDRHWYAYDVLLDGETILSNSRDPEHDLVRALLAHSHFRYLKGDSTIRRYSPSRKRTPAMRRPGRLMQTIRELQDRAQAALKREGSK